MNATALRSGGQVQALAGGMDDDRGVCCGEVRDAEVLCMPNWCENALTISGPPVAAKKLKRFVNTADSAFDFSVIVPPPRSVRRDWYYDNWGTSKVAFEVEWRTHADDLEADSITVCFLTAWSPPVPLLIRLSQLFPTLCLRLSFGGWEMDERGFVAAVAGTIIAQKYESAV